MSLDEGWGWCHDDRPQWDNMHPATEGLGAVGSEPGSGWDWSLDKRQDWVRWNLYSAFCLSWLSIGVACLVGRSATSTWKATL